MQKTRILEPTEYNNDKMKRSVKLNFDTLEHTKYDEKYTFHNFLESLGFSEDDYINAIKCSLNRTTILLERKPVDIWTNSFSHHIPGVWNANIDSQFLLHSYAVATSCSTYMTKLDGTIIETFRHIRKEHQKTNIDIIQTISRLGKALLNLPQMSVQQDVYIVLSLSLNTSSRKCIFMNTSH